MTISVDMNDAFLRDVASDLLQPFDGCNPMFSAAVEQFSKKIMAISSASLSLTSRRYSIWTLVRQCLDDGLDDLIRTYPGKWSKELLINFRFSAIGRTQPGKCVHESKWRAAELVGNYVDLNDLIVVAPRHNRKIPFTAVECQLKNIWAWDQNIRFSIHSASQNAVNSPTDLRALREFCATLDTARAIIEFVASFRPNRGRDPLDNAYLIADSISRPQGTTYCKLCWRETSRSEALKGEFTGYGSSNRRRSSRYCQVHDPSENPSDYRNDLRYQRAFEHELLALRGLQKSKYPFKIDLANNLPIQDIRKAAYELVHSGLPNSRLDSNNRNKLREKIYEMHLAGKKQTEIAKHLKLHRQSVSRTLKGIQRELERMTTKLV